MRRAIPKMSLSSLRESLVATGGVRSLICCPACREALAEENGRLCCLACRTTYEVTEGRPILLTAEDRQRVGQLLGTHNGRTMLHNYTSFDSCAESSQAVVKRFLTHSLDLKPFNVNSLIARSSSVLNLGAGTKRFGPHVINLDIAPVETVDVVGVGERLPFWDASFDAIILCSVLEHVNRPWDVVNESYRVLRPGGEIYIYMPFLQPYHNCPGDFWRCTQEGLEQLCAPPFQMVRSGVSVGPTATLLSVFAEWVTLWTGSSHPWIERIVKGIVLLPTFWMRYLDLLLARNPRAHRISCGIFFHGRKPLAAEGQAGQD